MIFAHDNLIDQGTLTVYSEDLNYPRNALRDYHLSNAFRSTGLSTDEWIKIELDDSSSADIAALVGHNLSTGATIKIQGNTADTWDAPTVDESMDYSTGPIWKQFTGAKKKYWRFTISDTDNSDTYIEVGRAIITNKTDLTNTYSNTYTEAFQNTGRVRYSITGQPFGVRGYEYRTLSLNVPYMDTDDKENMRDMFADVQQYEPILCIPDTANDNDVKPIYCVLEEPFTANHIFKHQYQGPVTLREVF